MQTSAMIQVRTSRQTSTTCNAPAMVNKRRQAREGEEGEEGSGFKECHCNHCMVILFQILFLLDFQS